MIEVLKKGIDEKNRLKGDMKEYEKHYSSFCHIDSVQCFINEIVWIQG